MARTRDHLNVEQPMSHLPLVKEISSYPSVPKVLATLSDWPGLVLFDSALPLGNLGRYSFLSAEPFATFVASEPVLGSDPFHEVRDALQPFETNSIQGLPPFQGGAAGILAYELGRCWERLPVPRWNEFDIPISVVGLYDWVLAWDHQQQRCWYISHGFPETTSSLKLLRGEDRWDRIAQRLSTGPRGAVNDSGNLPALTRSEPIALAAPSHPLPSKSELLSNFTRNEYLDTVQQVIEYIHAGDIFQANLSQRLLFPARLTPVEQYLSLRRENPAPFAGYFAYDDWAVLSSSPERFLQVRHAPVRPVLACPGGPGPFHVSTRPIKGTRQRRPVPEADLFTRDELRESEKDQAENVMIVDLLRNDLSRVCRPGSIRVPELCHVEAYETVTHLVSEVTGELRPESTFWDVIRATFPGGSITGAPKIRAMEIITELEQVARGPYCGSLFYLGFDGTADSNILIRTMTQRHGWLHFPVGGGIVAQSQPQDEYAETLHKAWGMMRALPQP